MKKFCGLIAVMCAMLLPCQGQQIMYANLGELLDNDGDTATTLQVERRSKNQVMLFSGGDYHIETPDNRGLNRYLRRRCYAVRMDSALYVNCRKMRYKHYRFGNWYAPALRVGRHIFFQAQPVGQAATSTFTSPDAQKLAGEVGDAIAASALVNVRVYYEINPKTGRAEFVGKERLLQLLAGYPHLQHQLIQETDESAEVVGKYLKAMSLGVMETRIYAGLIPQGKYPEVQCRLVLHNLEYSGDGIFTLSLTYPEIGGKKEQTYYFQGRRFTQRGDAVNPDAVVWQLVSYNGKQTYNFLVEENGDLTLLNEYFERYRPDNKYTLEREAEK